MKSTNELTPDVLMKLEQMINVASDEPSASNEKAPGKGQLTTGQAFDVGRVSGKYPPVKNGVIPFTLFRADQLGEPVETADFVQGLLTEGGASVVYGPSNTGKSFWVLELAASVASGRPFMDSLQTDQGSVIYFALEGIHGARNRIHALRQSGRLAAGSPLHLCFEPLSLLNERDVDKMIAAIKEAEWLDGAPCKLVIVDTLARAMPGGDENQGRDMGKYVFGKDKSAPKRELMSCRFTIAARTRTTGLEDTRPYAPPWTLRFESQGHPVGLFRRSPLPSNEICQSSTRWHSRWRQSTWERTGAEIQSHRVW